jgi:hypothetical protein
VSEDPLLSNNRRYDLSDRLIHFFRSVDLSSGNGFTAPESWGPGEIVGDDVVSPMFLLRNAVRLGRIWATWSKRGDRRTIYGPHPAVCFTEMPLAAFIEAGILRQQMGQAMSPYGLIFPKPPMYEIGARPVIYGLSSSPWIPAGEDGGERLIPVESLPLHEQYRYVTYAPGRVDWTHEREWRWVCTEEMPTNEFDVPMDDGMDIPGLDLNQPALAGLGAIVKTNEQAQRLIHDVLTIADRASRQTGNYEFVISLENLNDLGELRDPQHAEAAVREAAFDLSPFFQQSRSEHTRHLANYRRAVNDAVAFPVEAPAREIGGCWLWLTDARHPTVRALVNEGLAIVNREGRYLVEVDDFDADLPLAAREGMTRRLAKLLLDRHGVNATYHSVLGSYDPDGVPHYSDPPLDDRFHFNHGHEEDDF